MSPSRSSSGTNELYISHEADPTMKYTTTRGYFTDTLDDQMLENIRHTLKKLSPEGTLIERVDGYPHYLAVQWLHIDVKPGTSEMKDAEDQIKHCIDLVLSTALGWQASVIRELKDFDEVQKKAHELRVNWSRGQYPL